MRTRTRLATLLVAATPALLIATAASGVAAAREADAAYKVAAEAAAAPDPADFQLRPASNQADLTARTQALGGKLPTASVADVLAEANRTGTVTQGSACNTDAVEPEDPITVSTSFCWESDDAGTPGGASEWYPQSISSSADAGTGDNALMVGWYDKTSPEKGVRISFINKDTGKYQHVLLAYPTADGSYEGLLADQDDPSEALHAGGIIWDGKYLYVADTARGFRVFDTSYILDLKSAPNGDVTDKTKVGLVDGTWYGYGYRYVLPEIAAWSNVAGESTGEGCTTGSGIPKFSYAAIDNSDNHFVTGEYCNGTSGDLTGRVARWPAPTNPLATTGTWSADEANRLPESNVQGAMTSDGSWYTSRSSGPPEDGENDASVLRKTTASGGVLQPGTAIAGGIGSEDLSLWGTDLWTLTEHPGARMVYSTPLSAFGG